MRFLRPEEWTDLAGPDLTPDGVRVFEIVDEAKRIIASSSCRVPFQSPNLP